MLRFLAQNEHMILYSDCELCGKSTLDECKCFGDPPMPMPGIPETIKLTFAITGWLVAFAMAGLVGSFFLGGG